MPFSSASIVEFEQAHVYWVTQFALQTFINADHYFKVLPSIPSTEKKQERQKSDKARRGKMVNLFFPWHIVRLTMRHHLFLEF